MDIPIHRIIPQRNPMRCHTGTGLILLLCSRPPSSTIGQRLLHLPSTGEPSRRFLQGLRPMLQGPLPHPLLHLHRYLSLPLPRPSTEDTSPLAHVRSLLPNLNRQLQVYVLLLVHFFIRFFYNSSFLFFYSVFFFKVKTHITQAYFTKS